MFCTADRFGGSSGKKCSGKFRGAVPVQHCTDRHTERAGGDPVIQRHCADHELDICGDKHTHR